MTLGDTVEVWYATTDEFTEAAALAGCRARLTREDLARLEQARFDRNRPARIIGWALARTVLSRHADVAPDAWRFRDGQHGRPDIVGPAGAPPLRFNLSHAAGLVACAVTLADAIGVDVENVRRRTDFASIADRFFAPSEAAALERLSHADRPMAFFEYWTLKEAYLKARGAGISLPTAQVAFECSPDRAPVASFGPAIGDDPAAWQFAHLRPTPTHVVAIALHRPPTRRSAIVLRRAIPGVDL